MFIAIEGINGSGKGEQAVLTAGYFALRGAENILLTREPNDSEEGKLLRKLLSKPVSDIDPEKLNKLFLKDREDHLVRHVKPALRKGYVVITDRYKYSSIAYQQAQGLHITDLIHENKHFTTPDATFIIDVPVEEALKRIGRNKQAFENQEFLTKTRNVYLRLPRLLPKDNLHLIDGRGTPYQVFDRIRHHLEKLNR
jgi:dTMP kinase